MTDKKCTTCENPSAVVVCDSCKRPFCRKCSGLTPEEVKCLGLRGRKLLFLCDECEVGLPQIPHLFQQLKDIKAEVENLKQDVAIKHGVASQTATQNTGNPSAEQLCYEMEDRQRRRCNVIITDIAESKKTSRMLRYKDDVESVKQVLESMDIEEFLGAEDDEDSDVLKFGSFKILRLGKYDNNKNRMIKVIFTTEVDALNVLRNKRNLKIPNLKIFADQTYMQRNYYLLLKKQLDQLHAKGEVNKIIKYVNNIPKIVVARSNDVAQKN